MKSPYVIPMSAYDDGPAALALPARGVRFDQWLNALAGGRLALGGLALEGF